MRAQAVMLPLLVFGGCEDCDSDPSMITAWVVRHAEKCDATDPKCDTTDPYLTDAGEERALDLAERLDGSQLVAAYHTQYQRTRLTAQPTVDAQGLPTHEMTAGDNSTMVNHIISNYQAEAVLIVGHSTTVIPIIEEFGADPSMDDIDEDEYDRLFIVFYSAKNGSSVLEQEYGEASP